MKVLLAGASGFLGRYLARQLAPEHELVLLSRHELPPEAIPACSRCYSLSRHALADLFEREQPELVINTVGNYGRADEPVSMLLEANLEFPARLLELSCAHAVQVFINAGTVLPSSLNRYAATKNAFVELAQSVIADAPLQFINLRLEQFYGDLQLDRSFIGRLALDLLANRPVIAMSPGQQCRDLIHVEDVCVAIARVIERRQALGRFDQVSVGTGQCKSYEQIASLIKQIAGSSSELALGAIPYRRNEVMHSTADTCVLNQLGWQPRITLEEGMAATIEQYRNSSMDAL